MVTSRFSLIKRCRSLQLVMPGEIVAVVVSRARSSLPSRGDNLLCARTESILDGFFLELEALRNIRRCQVPLGLANESLSTFKS